MIINRNNYEEYLLDYLEGELKGERLKAMEAFLKAHPEILEEVEGLDNIRLEAPSITYPKPENLIKKIPVPHPYTSHDECFSAYVGGDLTTSAMKEVEDHVKRYPDLIQAFKAFHHTRLIPDLSITYPNKASLKRSIPLYGFIRTRPLSRYVMAIAAAMGLLLTSLWIGQIVQDQQQTTPAFADVKADRPLEIARPLSPSSSVEKTTMALAEKEAMATSITPSNKTITKPIQQVASPRESRYLHALQLPTRTAQVSLAAGHTHAQLPDIILPRYQTSGINVHFLANEMHLAEANVSSSLPAQILQWVGLGRQNDASNTSLDPTAMLWSVADKGIDVFNTLTDNEIQLLRSTDETGNVVAYAFVTERFEIARKAQRD